jgi:hypothetical protein
MDNQSDQNPFSLPESKIIFGPADKGNYELSSQEFMPAILIGLGGTGKEVLLRIRREFVQKYGSLDEFPIVSYLYIDTDNAPAEESGMARDRDYLINDIDFKPSEKIFNPVNPSEYIHSIDSMPHIKKWLNTTGEIGKLGTMNTGAGQIRPAARLSFFHNYDEIVNKLTSAKSRITDSKSINLVKDKHNIKNVTTEKINVYVITSLSGGTGSGTFIDMGFLLRHIFRNQAVTTCYCVLPKIFQGYGKERIYANSYAALKELEHYNFKNKFISNWKKNETFTFQPGVYDDVYLIDGENVKNLSLSDLSSRDIYRMIADTIFTDFANSDFANYKRGVRVNLLQYKQRFYPESEEVSDFTFSRKYSSLGQATLSIPADRIILSCAYKLCKDIIDYYLTYAEGTQSDIDSFLLDEFLPELGLLEYGKKHFLLDSLYKIGDKSSIQTKIKEFTNSIFNDLTSGKIGDNWSGYINERKSKFDTNFRDDADIQRQGLFYSQMNSNRLKILEEIAGDEILGKTGLLERKINSLINDSSRGVFYTINALRRLQFIFTNSNFDYLPAFEKQIKELRAKISQTETSLKRKFQDLKEDESRSKLNILRKAAMQGTLEKFLATLEEYYNLLTKLKARVYAKDIITRLLNIIESAEKTENGNIKFSGLIYEINKLTGNLGYLRDIFEKKYIYFSKSPEDSFNQYLYNETDIDNLYYPKYIGTGNAAGDNIKILSDSLLKELGARDVTDIVNILKDSDSSLIEKSMIEFGKRQFEKIRTDFNITDLLFEKEPLRSESKIRGLLSEAFPWLKIYEVPGSFKLDDSAKKTYIGIKTDSVSFPKFRNLISSIVGSSVEFKDSADNTSIIFYTEWAGFPLFYSYAISGEMKPYYNSMYYNHNIDLHTDKNYFVFEDIIPMDAEEKYNYDESYKAFIMGLIFDVFDIEEDEANGIVYKFSYREGITVVRTEHLGIESRLINRLVEDSSKYSLRNRILSMAEDRKNEMINSGHLAELLAILEYYYDEVYKPEEIELSGGAHKKLETYKYKFIRELAREIEDRISISEMPRISKIVNEFKSNPDRISRLLPDGKKRVLKYKDIIENSDSVVASTDEHMTLEKLRNLKSALEEGLISEEDYKMAKENFLKNN